MKIFQINMDRDTNRVAFSSYERVVAEQGAVDASIYDEVFSGDVDADDLEEIYGIFNLNHPEGYAGRSLSVSDVVQIDCDGKPAFFYCDSIGWQEVSFQPSLQ